MKNVSILAEIESITVKTISGTVQEKQT